MGSFLWMSFSAAEIREGTKKISYDEKIILGRKKLVKYKNINNFLSFLFIASNNLSIDEFRKENNRKIFEIISF